jgi:hypothetical protein
MSGERFVYLDQNHLSFLAAVSGPVSAEHRKRFDDLIEAREIRLVVGLEHVYETARWSDAAKRQRLSAYVDSCSPVYLRDSMQLRLSEARSFFDRLFGATEVAVRDEPFDSHLRLVNPSKLRDPDLWKNPTRGARFEERSFAVAVESLATDPDGLRAIRLIFVGRAQAHNVGIVIPQSNSLSPEAAAVLSSVCDAALKLGVLPERVADGSRTSEEHLRKFVDAFARYDSRWRRFASQLDEELRALRRGQVPGDALRGVPLEGIAARADEVGTITDSDIVDRARADAVLYCDDYVVEASFADMARKAIRGVPDVARVHRSVRDFLGAAA